MIGKIFNNYKIVSQLGEGGMGVVYLGVHETLGRNVALKFLSPEFTSDIQLKQRFINEAKILSKLSHPNIVLLYDFLQTQNDFVIVMEYVEGKLLSDMIHNNIVSLTEDRVINIYNNILNAFSYAHKLGIVHRDIKPSNIIIKSDDTPKIMDFGIAKIFQGDLSLTKAGTQMGSPLYMSPEQILGNNVDYKSDIYSLGVTLFETLSGRLPFNLDADTEYQIQSKIVNEPFPRISSFNNLISKSTEEAILSAVSKNPSERFPSCDVFNEALNMNKSVNYNSNNLNYNKTVYSTPNFITDNNKYTDFGNNQKKKNINVVLLFSIISLFIIAFVIYFAISQKKDFIESKNNINAPDMTVSPYKDLNISGNYEGTIKDGTFWTLNIYGFDGNSFNGSNTIFWSFVKNPNGLTAPFTGKYDKNTGAIEMSEDVTGKKTGKFIGNVSKDGKTITGSWYRYSDNGSYNWNLAKK